MREREGQKNEGTSTVGRGRLCALIAYGRKVFIDGWEPICSYNHHCDRCLIRMFQVAQGDGTVVEKE
jgi:hypothetical protein